MGLYQFFTQLFSQSTLLGMTGTQEKGKCTFGSRIREVFRQGGNSIGSCVREILRHNNNKPLTNPNTKTHNATNKDLYTNGTFNKLIELFGKENINFSKIELLENFLQQAGFDTKEIEKHLRKGDGFCSELKALAKVADIDPEDEKFAFVLRGILNDEKMDSDTKINFIRLLFGPNGRCPLEKMEPKKKETLETGITNVISLFDENNSPLQSLKTYLESEQPVFQNLLGDLRNALQEKPAQESSPEGHGKTPPPLPTVPAPDLPSDTSTPPQDPPPVLPDTPEAPTSPTATTPSNGVTTPSPTPVTLGNLPPPPENLPPLPSSQAPTPPVNKGNVPPPPPTTPAPNSAPVAPAEQIAGPTYPPPQRPKLNRAVILYTNLVKNKKYSSSNELAQDLIKYAKQINKKEYEQKYASLDDLSSLLLAPDMLDSTIGRIVNDKNLELLAYLIKKNLYPEETLVKLLQRYSVALESAEKRANSLIEDAGKVEKLDVVDEVVFDAILEQGIAEAIKEIVKDNDSKFLAYLMQKGYKKEDLKTRLIEEFNNGNPQVQHAVIEEEMPEQAVQIPRIEIFQRPQQAITGKMAVIIPQLKQAIQEEIPKPNQHATIASGTSTDAYSDLGIAEDIIQNANKLIEEAEKGKKLDVVNEVYDAYLEIGIHKAIEEIVKDFKEEKLDSASSSLAYLMQKGYTKEELMGQLLAEFILNDEETPQQTNEGNVTAEKSSVATAPATPASKPKRPLPPPPPPPPAPVAFPASGTPPPGSSMPQDLLSAIKQVKLKKVEPKPQKTPSEGSFPSSDLKTSLQEAFEKMTKKPKSSEPAEEPKVEGDESEW